MEFKSGLIAEAWHTLKNYEVEDSGEHPEVSVVYFTSNALYWTDDDETVRRRVFESNRYDYRHYRRRKIKGQPVREIFVRDVRKQWYLGGISSTVDSAEKLAVLLKELTAGTKIITVGNSAGGYAACLFGALIGAEQIFSFSGQFSLKDTAENSDELLEETKALPAFEQYCDLTDLISASASPVFFFYPDRAPQDRKQYPLVLDNPNVYLFAMKGSVHGSTVLDYSIPSLLALDAARLKDLSVKYSGRSIDPVFFSVQTAGPGKTAYALVYDGIKKIYRKIRY